jgi:plasmid stability protein
MATLHVRSVPEDLYAQLRQMANAKRRSLSAQVVEMLEQAIEIERQREQQATLLASIRSQRYVPPVDAPDSILLLREDRRR